MNDVTDLIESLLYQGEGESLDFKRDQYPFDGTDDVKKSEILKDILAFANSWRRTDAYILIGVQAEIGKRHTVVGTEQHFDDAILQQFVNSKTNRKITFSYNVYAFEEKKIGIIHIPIQERPTYANKDFGKVKKEFIYYRLGSSTAVAKPEEIAKMGKDSHLHFLPGKPVICLDFANLTLRQNLGKETTIKCLSFAKPSSPIPSLERTNSSNTYFGSLASNFERPNPDYWRECEIYLRTLALVQPIGFFLENQSSVLAQNVRIEIHGNSEDSITVFDLDSVPDEPVRKEMEITTRSIRSIHEKDIRTKINSFGSKWVISVDFGNIQPRQRIWSEEPFFVGCTSAVSLKMEAIIYADNLPEPQKESLSIQFDIKRSKLTLEELKFNLRYHSFLQNNSDFHQRLASYYTT